MCAKWPLLAERAPLRRVNAAWLSRSERRAYAYSTLRPPTFSGDSLASAVWLTQLLSPIRHRSETGQAHLVMIRARAGLVETRTKLVNSARGLTKSMGERLPSCDTDRVSVELLVDLPPSLQAALQPLMTVVQSLTEQIHIYDQKIAQIARSE